MVKKILFSTAAVLAATSAVNAQVLINEFNTEGTEEFVELYNAGGGSVNLADYALVGINGGDDLIYGTATFPLSGNIAAGGYFLISYNEATILGATPDLNLAAGAGVLQNGPDGLALISGVTSVDFGAHFQNDEDYSFELGENTAVQVDAIIYDDTGTPADAPNVAIELGITGAKVIQSQTANNTQSVQRVTDGQGGANDSWAVSDWTITAGNPGAMNQVIISPVVDVANIAAALAESDGTEVRITSAVTVVSPIINGSASRNAFYIQDASGGDGQSAIVIDDPTPNITTTFATGDTIINIQGTLSTFGGTRQLATTVDASVNGTVTPPAPLTLTAGVTDINDVLSELIRINGVTIAETGTFAADTNYTFLTPSGLVATIMRVEDASTLVGQTIPGSAFDVIGIAGQFGGAGQIFPRTAADVFASSSVETWEQYSH